MNSKGERSMFETTRQFLEALTLPAVLAAFGGVARALRFGVQSWRQFVGSVVVSAFSGVLVHLFIIDMDISPSVQAALVATAGYSGGCILDAMQGRIVQLIETWGPKAPPKE